MKFILNRNRTISSTQGHTVEFVKGVPTHVPKEMWNDVIAVGAVPEEEIDEEAKKSSNEPSDPVERKKMIFDAFETVVLAAQREDFTAHGVPHIKALINYLGFTIDGKERDALWQEFKELEKNKDD